MQVGAAHKHTAGVGCAQPRYIAHLTRTFSEKERKSLRTFPSVATTQRTSCERAPHYLPPAPARIIQLRSCIPGNAKHNPHKSVRVGKKTMRARGAAAPELQSLGSGPTPSISRCMEVRGLADRMTTSIRPIVYTHSGCKDTRSRIEPNKRVRIAASAACLRAMAAWAGCLGR